MQSGAMATRGTAVIAGIIMRDENATEPDDIVALSPCKRWYKFIPPRTRRPSMAPTTRSCGRARRDSHAEVLARRGFLRVLYRELNRLMDTGESPLLERFRANRATLRRGRHRALVRVHGSVRGGERGGRGDVAYEWIERRVVESSNARCTGHERALVWSLSQGERRR